MPSVYKLFVEIGRTATFKTGPLKGNFGVIYEIIDVHRVMIEGPEFERRQVYLTDLELQTPVAKISRGASRDALLQAIKDQDLVAKYQQTSAYKRTARQQRRSNLTDFERFVARRLRKQRANLIRQEYNQLAKPLKDAELAEKKTEAKRERIEKANVKNSFKNLSRKITKRSKARKAFEERKNKREQTATAQK